MLNFLSNSVKNLGFTLHYHLSMNEHISTIAETCHFELRHLASICRFRINTATATLVSAFVLSRIVYCKSRLFGSTRYVTFCLQQMQNNVTQVILHIPKSSNITTQLKPPHWLPVKVSSTYNISCLGYNFHKSTVPLFVTDSLQKSIAHPQHSLQLTHLASFQ